MVLAAGSIVLATAAAVGIWSVHVTEEAIETRIEPREVATDLAATARRLGAMGSDGEALSRVLAEEQRALHGSRLVLIGPGGDPILAVPPLPPGSVARRSDGGVAIEATGAGGRVEAQIVVGPSAEVTDAAGRAVGTLHLVPGEPQGPLASSRRQTRTYRRSLLPGVLLVGVLALAATALAAGRILAPIHELTLAARRMQSGEAGVRVRATRSDEVGELGAAFNAMAESLDGLERARRTMVGDVAHELRTPLTRLRADLEALQDGLRPLDGAAVDALHVEALHLGRLVDDLQDLALASAGSAALRLESLDVAAEAARAVASAASGEVRQAPAVTCPPGLRVLADPVRLQQILRNLVGNALAHTPPAGSITVGARAAGSVVEMWVADEGEGIAPDDLPHVFERLYRADASRSRATGGTGLGLAIVKQLVERHGGRISAESEPGRGSTFRITLPRPD